MAFLNPRTPSNGSYLMGICNVRHSQVSFPGVSLIGRLGGTRPEENIVISLV